MCWGFAPLEVEQHNIEVGPFAFSAPPTGCYVQNKFDLVCRSEIKTGFPGDEFKHTPTYFEDYKGVLAAAADYGGQLGTRPM